MGTQKGPTKTILVLCSGNSARSQMAEALINTFYSERWRASSAGTRPTGRVHPLALRVLEELGIEHRGRSKHVDELKGVDFNLVLTVCDTASEECPLWLGKGRPSHLSVPDPAIATGDEEARLEAFRSARDLLKSNLPRILQSDPSPQGPTGNLTPGNH